MSCGERHWRQVATMSRRSFLKSTGLAVAGATALETGLAAMAAASEPGAPGTAGPAEVALVGPGPVQMDLVVNGMARRVAVEPSTTLVDVLRDQLGLTGTKVGCDRGACSACTIWLDRVPVASCMLLALDVGSRKITTIEGLASGSTLHPVQAAFVAHDAVQCGFCTPGLVMTCAALVDGQGNPSSDDIRSAVSGHLCRCGTLTHAVEATLDAAHSAKG
jgi:aerobic-type carbon monoxide dehydrogenase small subunit (CoxS/CutS family)